MRQAIETKFLPPTNHRGARIRVRAQAGFREYPWNHALDSEANHLEAAKRFAKEKGWEGLWYGSSLASGNHVFTNANTLDSFVV
jgi:hypothetical protein